MYNSSIPFIQEEIDQLEQAGLTVGELRDFFERYPDQDFVTAVGGAVMEKKGSKVGRVSLSRR